MRTLWLDDDGRWHTKLRGRQILSDPRLNRGTAFSYAERHELGMTGLIPPAHVTLDQQVARVYAQYQRQPTDLAKNVLLTEVHDRNEVLFYRLLITHLPEMLPIVYTPTIGQAIKSYSHEYRRPRGVYLSVDHPELIEESLLRDRLGGQRPRPDRGDRRRAPSSASATGASAACTSPSASSPSTPRPAASTPEPVAAVMLDVGTDRQSLLDDPLYIGNRHPRVPPDEYDEFLDAFVETASRLFPHAMLHWEDIGLRNARRLLDRYRDRLLTFNDDIQGTGAVNLAAVLAAVRATGTSLADHRIVIFGAGTAGTGIADQLRAQMLADGLTEEEASARFWAIDRHGLLTTDMAGLSDAQRRCARDPAEVAGWRQDPDLAASAWPRSSRGCTRRS